VRATTVALALALFGACGDDSGGAADAAPADAVNADASFLQPQDRDILETRLTFDLAAHDGRASIDMAAGTGPGASLEVGDLEILEVTSGGAPVPFVVTAGNMMLALAPGAATVDLHYHFEDHAGFQGWNPNPGYSLTWPYFCHNLFPCDSFPVDGYRFQMDVTGVPSGQVAVYPASIPADAPSYMPAITVGDYTYTKIGSTTAATEVGVWTLPGDTMTGVANLDQYFDFYEKTYGPYLFGAQVASVSGPAGASGGMEHHPLWHIAKSAMGDENVHAHEAAHGWFGDGVRLACWEDFVLSEGTVTYLAARAIESVEGQAAGDAQWAAYQSDLDSAVATQDTLAWPADPCNTIDINNHPVWSRIPYDKGAFFYKAVEARIGRSALDTALHDFYVQHQGGAARMQDLIDVIQSETSTDISDLVTGWLRSMGVPT
jgi:hypothetical protein